MTFKTRTCITLHCNACGQALDQDGFTPHYDPDDEARAFEEARNADWVVKDDGSAYCTRTGCAPNCTCDDCEDEDCTWRFCPKCPRHGESATLPITGGKP